MAERGSGRGGYAERRRQADWVCNSAAILSLLSWVFSIIVLFVLEQAQPQSPDLFTNIFGTAQTTIRTTWNDTLLPLALIFLVLSTLMCVAAFIFNMMRMRRATDKIRKSVLIIGGLNIIGLIFFLVRFSNYIF